MNRNAWQQLLAGKRVGGPAYEGGHSAPSFFAAPGERIGLFAQHQFQNRGFGAPNVGEARAKFYRVEEQIRDQVKKRLETGQPVDLDWAMSTPSGGRPGLPDTFTLEYGFDGAVPESLPFNNLMK